MDKFTNYIDDLNDYINKNLSFNDPNNLYDPVKYILQNGGKRVRSLFTLFISESKTDILSSIILLVIVIFTSLNT